MIVNPIDNNKYSIYSIVGRNLLKQYIKNYKNGGMKRRREDDETSYPYRDLSFPTSKRIRTGTGRRVRSRYGQMKLDYLKDKLTELEDDRRSREIIPKIDSEILKVALSLENPFDKVPEGFSDETSLWNEMDIEAKAKWLQNNMSIKDYNENILEPYRRFYSRINILKSDYNGYINKFQLMSTDLFDVDRFVNKIMKKYSTPDKLIEFIISEYSRLDDPINIDIVTFKQNEAKDLLTTKETDTIINLLNTTYVIPLDEIEETKRKKKERHKRKNQHIRDALKWLIF